MHGTILHVGPIAITSYALMLTLAFLAGTLLAARRARRYGISSHELANVANLIIISSIAGSRLLYALEEPDSFAQDPVSIFFIWRGGVSYHGALFLSVISVLCWLRWRHITAGALFDAVAPSIALGFFLVRIGCFLNGCCFGTPTDMPWGVAFPLNSPAGQVYQNMKVHPTQLYEAVAGLATLFVLLALEGAGRFRKRPFVLFFSTLAISAVWRFFVEFYRHHESGRPALLWFSEAQVYCIIILTLAIPAIVRFRDKRSTPSAP